MTTRTTVIITASTQFIIVKSQRDSAASGSQWKGVVKSRSSHLALIPLYQAIYQVTQTRLSKRKLSCLESPTIHGRRSLSWRRRAETEADDDGEGGFGLAEEATRIVTKCCHSLRAYVVVVVMTGGRASDAVDESTGVAIEEESTGEEAAPNPNEVRGGRETSFSFSLAGADDGGCLTMSWGHLGRKQNRRQGRPINDGRHWLHWHLVGSTAITAALGCPALGWHWSRRIWQPLPIKQPPM
jgi:hypothetical protein